MKILFALFCFSTYSLAKTEVINPKQVSIVVLDTGYPGANSLVILNDSKIIFVLGNTELRVGSAEFKAETFSGPYRIKTIEKFSLILQNIVLEAKLNNKDLILDEKADEIRGVLKLGQ